MATWWKPEFPITERNRIRILNEIHSRTPVPLGPYTRLSHLVFVYPTREEDLLRNTMESSDPDEIVFDICHGNVEPWTEESIQEAHEEFLRRRKRQRSLVEEIRRNASETFGERVVVTPTRSASTLDGPITIKKTPSGARATILPHLYPANHNFTVFEEFADLETAPFAGRDAQGRLLIDPEITAFESVDGLFCDRKRNLEWKFEKTALLAAVNVWVVPLADLVGATPDRATPGHYEAMVSEAFCRVYKNMAREPRLPEEVPGDADREEIVFSKVLGGRGYVMTNLRYYGKEYATRILIATHDMSEEQRGRLIRRLTDMATYRLLSLRNYTFVGPISRQLQVISASLSQVLTEGDREETKRDAHQPIERTGRRLDKMHQMSRSLSRLNVLMPYGITGYALAVQTYSDLIQDRILSLREERIEGFQSFEEFFSRFSTSAKSIFRLSERYDALKRRIAEAASLANVELNNYQIGQIGGDAHQQTKLQNTLEFLTYAAFIYYAGTGFKLTGVGALLANLISIPEDFLSLMPFTAVLISEIQRENVEYLLSYSVASVPIILLLLAKLFKRKKPRG